MARERETRTERDFWGNEHEYIYEDGKRVGEHKIESRGGFLGIGDEPQKVEYDLDGNERGYSRKERQGGFLGIGEEEVEANYDDNRRRAGYSRVEQRGGFLGIGTHHARIGYDEDGNEVSSTQSARRGGFLGIGERRARVTRYPNEDDETQIRHGSPRSGNDSDLTEGLAKLAIGLLVVFFAILLFFAVLLPLALVNSAALALGAAGISATKRKALFLVSAFGGAYVLFDYNAGWLTHGLQQTLPFLRGQAAVFVYINVSAALVSVFALLRPLMQQFIPLQEEYRARQEVILAAGLVAVGCAIFATQRYADLRWQQEQPAVASTSLVSDQRSDPPTGAYLHDSSRDQSAPVRPPVSQSPTSQRPISQAPIARGGTNTVTESTSAIETPQRRVAVSSGAIPRHSERLRRNGASEAAAAEPPKIACVLPGGREARLAADQCESAGGMEYR
ncbi:MAG: hypothetical protein JWO81_3459 [Alphaproteobacteria bacterium]|nr:hypothetical protein [Alphaproteobacteria bacterium]